VRKTVAQTSAKSGFGFSWYLGNSGRCHRNDRRNFLLVRCA